MDGTKIEANANKYTFVWKKAVEKSCAKLDAKMEKPMDAFCEKYGFLRRTTALEMYQSLLRQEQLVQTVFMRGKGHRKTQLQRDIEVLEEYFAKKEELHKCLRTCVGPFFGFFGQFFDLLFFHFF